MPEKHQPLFSTTTAEAAFIDIFFKQTWGYRASGKGEKDHGYTLYPQYDCGKWFGSS